MEMLDVTPGFMRYDRAPIQRSYTESVGRARQGFAQRVGIDPNMGGRPRDEDRTWQTSDQLMSEILPRLTGPAAALVRDRKIERPREIREGDEYLGFYRSQPSGPGRVEVRRDVTDAVYEDFVAAHEIGHTLYVEHAPALDPPAFRAALSLALQQGPQYDTVLRWSLERGEVEAWANLFAYAVTRPQMIPPAIRDYFRDLVKESR